MPRKPRVDVPGAVYHVTARGNHQQRLFYTAEDYRVYLALLKEATERFGLRVLAYALLPNHVHLLCRRGPVPLAKVLHHVHRRFAVHHNRRLGVRGHAFEDRYHAKLCENEEYLWAVVRYIHDNPVQAGLCDRPDEYPWTSYHAYATGRWGLVDRDEAANLFGPPQRVRDLPPRPKNGGQRVAGNGYRAADPPAPAVPRKDVKTAAPPSAQPSAGQRGTGAPDRGRLVTGRSHQAAGTGARPESGPGPPPGGGLRGEADGPRPPP